MFKKLSYHQKNKLLLPLVGLGILLCWFLAFSKTFEAIRLNHELAEEANTAEDIAFNPVHTERKLDALQNILKSYRVSKEGWSNELWMKASAIAASRQVGIDYTMTKPDAEPDTTSVGISESLRFYGKYTQLVQLMDTLERIPRIGKISALQIRAPKEDLTGERAAQCLLKMEFRGMVH